MLRVRFAAIILAVVCGALVALTAQQPPALDAVVEGLTFRNIGPFRTAAWVTDVAVPAPSAEFVRTTWSFIESAPVLLANNTGPVHIAAAVGTPVTLWGDGLSCDDVAAAAGTLSYELLCKLTARVPIVEA